MYTKVLLKENYLAGPTIRKLISYIRYKRGLGPKFAYGLRFITSKFISKFTFAGNRSRMRTISNILRELQDNALHSTDERFASKCYNTIYSIFRDLKANCSEFNEDCNKLIISTEEFLKNTKQQQDVLREKIKPSLLDKIKSKLNVPALIGLTALSVVGLKFLFNYLNIKGVTLAKAPFVCFNILTSEKFNISIKVLVAILLILLLMGIYFLFRKIYIGIVGKDDSVKS